VTRARRLAFAQRLHRAGALIRAARTYQAATLVEHSRPLALLSHESTANRGSAWRCSRRTASGLPQVMHPFLR
jgi:hypothetical protein